MVGYKNNIDAYRNAFASVDKLNQVIMLYDGAIASIQQAKQAITNKNYEERYNKLAKAFHILTGLQNSLDFEAGGEIAEVLNNWYSQTSMRVLSINRTNDMKMCDLCIDHIKQMRDAWVDVERQIKTGSTNTTGSSDDSKASPSNNNSSSGGDFFTSIAKAAYGSTQTGGMVINV